MMLELFAQMNRGAAKPAAADPGDVIAIIMAQLIFIVIGAVIGIAIQIFFLLTLSKCLQAISPRNRTMEPGQVWLNLIPFFNYVWIFLTILKIAESLEKEFRSRGRPQEGDYGKTTGLIFIISSLVGCVCIAPIFWIIYWVKIAGFTKLLQSSKGRSKRVVEDDEEEEERPRPKRRPRDDDDE